MEAQAALAVNSLQWALGPMHVSMSMVGVHFVLNRQAIVKSVLTCLYFTLITFTHLYDVFRFFQTYKYPSVFGPTLVMKICVHVFYLSVIIGSLSQVRYSVKKTAL